MAKSKSKATVAPKKPMAPRKKKGMPGMRGVDHIGLTVPDVDLSPVID